MKIPHLLNLLIWTPFALVQVHAQTLTPASTPVDPAHFHTTSFFRLANGDFETIPAQTRDFAVLDQVSFKAIVDPLTGKPKIESNQTYIYDARNPLPKIATSGANYAVLADKSLITFSSTWDKPIPVGKLSFEVDTYGGNFMIRKDTREIVTVSATGYVNFATTMIAPAVRLVGGNFFIDANNDLWTIDDKGFVYHLDAAKYPSLYIKYPTAFLPGGNYFYQQDGSQSGSIVTISSRGLPLPAFTSDARPITLGGNYYIANDDVIYSIGYDGISYKNGPAPAKIKHLGYSYAISENGDFFVVDGFGVVHTDAVRVSTTKNKFVKTSKFTESLDATSVYTPNSRK